MKNNTNTILFFPFDTMPKRGLCRRAVSVCLSVRLSRSCILWKRVNASSFFSPSDIAHHSTVSLQNIMAHITTGRRMQVGYEKINIFDYLTLSHVINGATVTCVEVLYC